MPILGYQNTLHFADILYHLKNCIDQDEWPGLDHVTYRQMKAA